MLCDNGYGNPGALHIKEGKYDWIKSWKNWADPARRDSKKGRFGYDPSRHLFQVSEEDFKTDFAKDALTTFYDVMDYIFREGFGTGSKTTEKTIDGLAGLLFGK